MGIPLSIFAKKQDGVLSTIIIFYGSILNKPKSLMHICPYTIMQCLR